MSLSVAFLGYGFVGRAHASALARLSIAFPDAPAVERSVLVGRDDRRTREAADHLGFAAATTDLRAALDEADVLYVLAPNDRHVEPSVAALDRGVHVLCEKPLAPTLDGAERMAEAAAQSSVVAGCAFNYRFAPAAARARELVAEGALGEVRQVRARYLQDWLVDPAAPWTWRLDADRAGSGALGDLGAHSVDLAGFLLDDRVTRVSGHLRTFVDERVDADGEVRPVTVDDAVTAQVAFAGGATGVVEASRVATGHRNTHAVELTGTESAVRFDPGRPSEIEVCRNPDRGFERRLVTDPDDPYGDRWWPPGHVLGWEHPVVHENAAFLGAVAGDGEFRPSFADGRDIQRVLDAVERADERGAWVSV